MIHVPLFVLAATVSGAMTGGRLRDQVPVARNFLVAVFEWFGDLGLFCGRLIRAALAPPYEFGELLRQCDAIGSKSLPLVALAGAATGVVLSLQTRYSLIRFGAKAFLPAVIVFSIIKESGPIITGLIVSGRVGAGIGAELGSMKVTEQIDAMEGLRRRSFQVPGFNPRDRVHPDASTVNSGLEFLRHLHGLGGKYPR